MRKMLISSFDDDNDGSFPLTFIFGPLTFLVSKGKSPKPNFSLIGTSSRRSCSNCEAMAPSNVRSCESANPYSRSKAFSVKNVFVLTKIFSSSTPQASISCRCFGMRNRLISGCDSVERLVSRALRFFRSVMARTFFDTASDDWISSVSRLYQKSGPKR